MSVIQGILLGMLQGVAEFLPISSSGHLKIVQSLFGLENIPLLFDIFLHLATLFAVCLYFRKRLLELIKTFIKIITRKSLDESDKFNQKTIIAIIFSTIITGVIGIFTSKLIPDLPIKIICIGFLVTSLLLIFSSIIEKKRSSKISEQNQQLKPVSKFQSLFIGFMQGLGTLPGISRSGSTIAGALFSGVDKKQAGDFSFIISIPAILGAFILELKDLGEMSEVIGAAPIIAGCSAAFAVGFISLTFLMKMIRKGKLYWFSTYLIPLGILGILFL